MPPPSTATAWRLWDWGVALRRERARVEREWERECLAGCPRWGDKCCCCCCCCC